MDVSNNIDPQGSGWPMEKMWAKLNSGRTWYRADNEAYIYWNTMDSCWWIDKVTIIIMSCYN